jgi:hypothetical protein
VRRVQAPGFVNTAWGSEMPWYIKWLVRAIQPLGRSLYDCGEAMCVPLFSGGSGFVLVNSDGGGPVSVTSLHSDEAVDFMRGHTLEVLRGRGIGTVAAAASSEALK